MWIFLADSFLSIVAPTPHTTMAAADMLIVRARAEGDIERVFPDAEVEKSYLRDDKDYAFRAAIHRRRVSAAIAKQVDGITATNFKNSVKEGDRAITYQRVWAVMNDFQTQRGRPGKYGRYEMADMLSDPAYEEYLNAGRRTFRRSRK